MKQFGKSYLILFVVLGGITVATVFATGTVVPFTAPYQLNDTSNNAVRLYVDNSGNIGIGTTNPANRLHAIGPNGGLTSLIAENNNGKYIEAGAGTSGSAVDFDNSGYLLIRGKPHADEGLDVGSAEFVRITGSGNVGIGTTNPWGRLQVNSVPGPVPAISASSSGQYINTFPNMCQGCANPLVQSGDEALIFSNGQMNSGNFVLGNWNNASAGIRITNSGNVGIDTWNPSQALDVSGNIGLNGNIVGKSSSTLKIIPSTNQAICIGSGC